MPLEKKGMLLLAITLGVYLLGFGVNIMNVDAAQYAAMSREMLHSGSYLELFSRGRDYLDKPPLLFWLTSQSIRMFGVGNFAYKFPSFLFACLALWSTYRFSLLFYSRRRSMLAALVLGTTQALFLITNDVRTDTMLMGLVIFSIWQLADWLQTRRTGSFIWAFAGAGAAMLAKGPIALVVPILAFGSHLLLRRNFKDLFRWQYLIGLLIVALILAPFLYGLYQQFDLHPEKVMYGRTGTSGIGFYLWTQSFGRVTGQSTWNNGAGFLFQFQNLLWGFLPWTLFFILSIGASLVEVFRSRFRISGQREWISKGGFLLTYLAVSRSHYQLPHYIYVVLPLAAIMTAEWVDRLLFDREMPGLRRTLHSLHVLIFSLLWMAAFVLAFYVFPASPWYAKGLLIAGAVLYILALYQPERFGLPVTLSVSLVTILGINAFLSTGFYPGLLRYEAGSQLGHYIAAHNPEEHPLYAFTVRHPYVLDYYSGETARVVTSGTQFRPGDWIYAPQAQKDSIMRQVPCRVEARSADYPVQFLSLKFLNPSTRSSVVDSVYALRVQ